MTKSKKEDKPVMHRLYKEDGTEVNVSDRSLKHGLSIGWTKEEPKSKK